MKSGKANHYLKKLLTLLLFSSVLFPLISQSGETENPGENREELLLSFTGDLMAHSINYKMTDYDEIYRRVKTIFLEDDLTFTNAEFPMDPAKPMASFPSFNIHPVYLEAFVEAGLDVFSLANNHSADSGEASMLASLTAAEELAAKTEIALERPLYFSGIARPAVETPLTAPETAAEVREDGNTSESVISPAEETEESVTAVPPPEPYEITEIEKKGWKIGFLAVTQKSNVSADPEILYQVDYNKREESEPFLSWISEKSKEYDLFILSYHGGVEYNFIPVDRKRRFFHGLIQSGVDIVWGHHPHVIQEIEVVRMDDREGVIMYSLGNFLSGQGRIIDEVLPEEEWSYTGDSAVVQLRVEVSSSTEDENGSIKGLPEFTKVHPIPTANYITPNREVVIYPLETLVLHPLPSPWDDFYRERSRIMSGYFRENIRFSTF